MRSGGWTLLVLQSVKVITWLFYLLALSWDCLKARGAIYHTWNKGINKTEHEETIIWSLAAILHTSLASLIQDLKTFRRQISPSKDEPLPCSEVTACTGLCLPFTEGVCEAFRDPRSYTRQKSESLKRANLQAQVHTRLEGAPGGTWGPNARARHSHYHISTALLELVLRHLTRKALESTVSANGCIWENCFGKGRHTHPLCFPHPQTHTLWITVSLLISCKKFVLSLSQYTVRRYSWKLRKWINKDKALFLGLFGH